MTTSSLGGRPPRRPRAARGLRREAQEVALRRPADRPGALPPDAERREVEEAARAVHKLIKHDGRRPDRQRVRRGARGRADLRVRLRDGRRQQARPAALAQLDDEEGDRGGVRAPAPGRRDEAARGVRALALRGRLARRHERDARRLDPPARGVQRRRLARPSADADARARRAPREGDPRIRARAVLARRGRSRRPASALPRRYLGGKRIRRTRRRRSSPTSRASRARSRSSRRRRSASRRSSSTTSPRSSATRTRSTASPRAARSAPRSASTRSTRRSRTRARAPASSPAS